MLDLYKQLIADQYEAALCMLASAVDVCADQRWHEPGVRLTFSQAAFHALFFTEVYLGRDLKSLPEQAFHREHANNFGDYEELEPREQQASYEKPFIRDCVQHCRKKAARSLGAETAETLAHRPGFDWHEFSPAEVHVYNIRHIQHHAAQLSLVLRMETGEGVDWIGSAWRQAKRGE